ncbi:rhomboid family intramembrane serine protease [Escherichia coli]|nr:rhomboid family intramembrane serine protease [Escherichia coli]EJW6147693.1 rhomboid family intramembrane serine protease [Escherichia coli]EJX1059325.1 rhomboid family intramembrane serine protease [Escherichia coli]EKP6471124.1 rhomboid family intramembrane serine protease [Escherichia coli]EKP6524305.1 rhomboid family intramembrane serine protease [Escherichia coli]
MSASSVKPLNVQLPAITLILFALCVGIFCYLAQWMSYEEVDQSALIHLGANVASLSLSGEPWRLLSSVFLHSSFSHLLMNMFALLVVGAVTERILGKWRLLIIWLFSGVFGGLISACYALRDSDQIVISVGASGAIMGIAGAAIATQLASGTGTHHKNQRRVFPLLGMVALTLLYGARQTGIDNACHIGGLIAGGALGWLSARLSGQNRLVTEGGIIVAGSLLLTGAIWLAQQQMDESVLQVRQSLREEFYPQEIEQERRQKKQQLAEERNALRETLSAPVSREQASGDLLAEIADIHDMAISRDGNTLYAAIENTNSIVVFDLGQKKILHTFTAPIAKEKSVKHCGGCKDQGVRSLTLSPDETLLYATSFEANALSVINVATGEIIQSITTGAHPDSLILSRDGTKAWVMNRTSNSVSAIDLVTDIPLEKYDGTGTSNKPGAWVMALSPDEKILLIPGMVRGDIVRINTITHQKEDFPAGDARGTISAMRFRPENGDVIFADSQGISRIRVGDQQASIMTQWCSRSVYSVEGISPDGQYLALVSYGLQGYVILLNINAGQIVGVYPASYVNHLRFSADGRKIFVMAKNGLIQLDRTRSLDPQAIIRHPQYGNVACIPEP